MGNKAMVWVVKGERRRLVSEAVAKVCVSDNGYEYENRGLQSEAEQIAKKKRVIAMGALLEEISKSTDVERLNEILTLEQAGTRRRQVLSAVQLRMAKVTAAPETADPVKELLNIEGKSEIEPPSQEKPVWANDKPEEIKKKDGNKEPADQPGIPAG